LSSISASIEGSLPEKAAGWQANVSDFDGVLRRLNTRETQVKKGSIDRLREGVK
jgi:hypothetical protein